MVQAIEEALEHGHQRDLDWMTDETKKQALVKLHAIANKIGYPDRWRDYSSLQIVTGRRARQLAARQHFELPPPAGQDRQAGGQDRMA